MQRKILLFTLLGASTAMVCTAQKVTQKANTEVNKVNNGISEANNAINNANTTVSNAKQAADGVKSTFEDLLGKKKKKTVDAVKPDSVVIKPVVIAPGQSISICVNQIDYMKLKQLEDQIKLLPGVQTTIKKFAKDSSSIQIGFAESSDKLWDLLPQQARDKFELIGLTEKTISLTVKK